MIELPREMLDAIAGAPPPPAQRPKLVIDRIETGWIAVSYGAGEPRAWAFAEAAPLGAFVAAWASGGEGES